MAIMSKVETTSKVLLKLPSRINPGRRGTGTPRPRVWTQPISPPPLPPPTHTHTVWKALKKAAFLKNMSETTLCGIQKTMLRIANPACHRNFAEAFLHFTNMEFKI